MTKENVAARQPRSIRVSAKIISYIFHPLFIPSYIFLWTYWRFPYQFANITDFDFRMRFIGLFMTTAFFPAFTVFLLWKLKFIKNIQLRYQKERIVPYMAVMIYYWWMWYLSRNFTDQASSLKFFYFGIFIATVPALILNNFVKISMHAMGAAGALTAILLTCFLYQTSYGRDICAAAVIAGIICTARLSLSEHSPFEIYAGIAVGGLCQLIAFWIMT